MDDDEDEKPDIQPIENDTRNKEIIQTIVELEDEQEKNKKTRQDLERQKSSIVSKKDISASNLKTVLYFSKKIIPNSNIFLDRGKNQRLPKGEITKNK